MGGIKIYSTKGRREGEERNERKQIQSINKILNNYSSRR